MDAAQQPSIKALWPLWVAIGLPLLLVALDSTPLGPNFAFVMIGIPTLVVIWGALGLRSLILAVQHVLRREWSRGAISAVLPLAIVAAGVWHWHFLQLCNYGGQVGYFIAEQSSYAEQVRATPPDGEPRLLVFNRGGMLWASEGYVYDESDKVLRAESLRSAGWKKRADGTELTCGYHAQPFPGHFSFTRHWYLASFNC